MGTEKMERIMIVDDNKEFAQELKEILALAGYEPVAINNSSWACAVALRLRPDAILLDLRMNGKSGFQVAHELKMHPVTAHIPILAISGYFPVDDASSLLDRSFMSGVLKKPFAIADLITQLERILGQKVDMYGRAPVEKS